MTALAAQPFDRTSSGRLPDQDALSGVLRVVDALGLEVLEIRTCGERVSRPAESHGERDTAEDAPPIPTTARGDRLP